MHDLGRMKVLTQQHVISVFLILSNVTSYQTCHPYVTKELNDRFETRLLIHVGGPKVAQSPIVGSRPFGDSVFCTPKRLLQKHQHFASHSFVITRSAAQPKQ